MSDYDSDLISEYDLEIAFEEGAAEARQDIVNRIEAWLELANNDDRGYDLMQLLDRIRRGQ